MSAILQAENDAGEPITTGNLGAINNNSSYRKKFMLRNIGDTDAEEVFISAVRLGQNDGIDFITIAPDLSGSPGTFQSEELNVGTIPSGSTYSFWVQATIPSGTTPAGNPRQVKINYRYKGV